MSQIECISCGSMISDELLYCPYCGCKQKDENAPQQQETPAAPTVESPAPEVSPAAPTVESPAPEVNPAAPKPSKALIALDVILALIAALLGGVLISQPRPVETIITPDSTALELTPDPDSLARALEEEQILKTFNAFTSPDLSTFLLRAKVKEVTTTIDGYTTTSLFDETGELVKYTTKSSEGNTGYGVMHENGTLLLVMEGTFGTWTETYELRGGRLVTYEASGDGDGSRIVYSGHDTNGWPHTETNYEYDLMEDEWIEGPTRTVKYTDLDDHGNWLTKTDTHGRTLETRTIKYYPLAE